MPELVSILGRALSTATSPAGMLRCGTSAGGSSRASGSNTPRSPNCLVLSTRVEHVARLAERLESEAATVLVLHGKLAPKERRRIQTEISDRDLSDPFILVAIDKIAGEGFDLPSLNALFLAAPMAFKGRIAQQIGRISRASRPTTTKPGPATSQVHDYWDADVPVFDRMFRKRRRVIAKSRTQHVGGAGPDTVLTGAPRVTSAAASHSSGNSPSKLVVCPRKEPQ